MANFQQGQEWMQTTIIRNWNGGYQAACVSKIINSLPQPLISWFSRVLLTVSNMADESSRTMQKWTPLIGWGTIEKNSDWLATELCSYFENEKDAGLIQIDFDPTTLSREHVDFNTYFAGLWCMSKEELLFRFADYDVPLPYSDLDWLRNLIFDLETHFQNNTTRYSRLVFGSGQAARAVLVEVTTRKTFNAVGQVIQVRSSLKSMDAVLLQADGAAVSVIVQKT